MTKTTAINVLNQDALPEMTRKRQYVLNVRELYISFARKLFYTKHYRGKEKEDVTKLIEEKFDQLEKRLTSNLCNQENAPNSFVAAIKGQNVLPNFRKILRDERMNEKEEEHQQGRRQKNLMLTDEEFIKDLIKDVGVNAEVKFVTRIGNQTKKLRPIKVTL